MKTINLIISTLALCITLSSTAIAQEKWILVEGGNWTPEKELISSIESKIKNYIINESNKQENPISNLENYWFQYQGSKENGNQYVFINAFCEYPEDINLRKNMYMVLDGGNCYFTIKYHKDKKVFYQLFINGEA